MKGQKTESTWQWLSEQHNNNNARIAGNNACSNFNNDNVYNDYRFRAVFRPLRSSPILLLQVKAMFFNNKMRKAFVGWFKILFQFLKMFEIKISSKIETISMFKVAIIRIDTGLNLLDKF